MWPWLHKRARRLELSRWLSRSGYLRYNQSNSRRYKVMFDAFDEDGEVLDKIVEILENDVFSSRFYSQKLSISTIASDRLTIFCGITSKAFGDLPYRLDVVGFRLKSLFRSGKTFPKFHKPRKAVFDRNFHVMGKPVATERGTTEWLKGFTETAEILFWSLYRTWVRKGRKSLGTSTYHSDAYNEHRCRSSCPNLL